MIIADVQMMDVTAYKFIEIVQAIQDMPIVLVSEVDTSELLQKALDHGASDLICMPTIQELKLVWKYIKYRLLSLRAENKRVGDEHRDEKTVSPQKDGSENTRKIKRWRWTNELHEKFVHAVNQLGLDMASPKKIVELMDVPNLTQKTVGSYLQKFRQAVKGKGLVEWTNLPSENAIKYELNKKLSIMQQSSSSQPALSTNRIPQFESRGLIGKMPNSQVSVAPKFVPEHSFPIPISQNYAAALPNGNNFHAPCNPNLIEQSNMHSSSSPQLAKNSNFVLENPSFMHQDNAFSASGVNNGFIRQNTNHSLAGSNNVRVPGNTNLTGQSNMHMSFPQLAENSNFMPEISSFMHQDNAFTANGVNNIFIPQNTDHFGMVDHAQNVSPMMQPNHSSVGKNYVNVPCYPNLTGQSNMHISSSPQLAQKSSFMPENPGFMHQDTIFIGQNTDCSGIVNHDQNVSALMQQKHSSVLNRTDNNFSQMARNQLNRERRNESSATVPVRNAYSLLNQRPSNAALIGQEHSYVNPNTTSMSNWKGNNTIRGTNSTGMMLSSNNANQGLNRLNNFTRDNVSQNHSTMGGDHGTHVIGGFGSSQSTMVEQNEYTRVLYQGHDVFNDLNGNVIDQNHGPRGSNMQNYHTGMNDTGVAYPGESGFDAHIGNSVNENPTVSLENNTVVQGMDAGNDNIMVQGTDAGNDDLVLQVINAENDNIMVHGENAGNDGAGSSEILINADDNIIVHGENAGNDGAGSSERRMINADDFVSHFLNVDADAEHEWINN